METYQHTGEMIALAFEGLKQLYDSHQKLYGYQVRDGRTVSMPLAWSVVYTAINLIGLSAACSHGHQEASRALNEDLESVVAHAGATRRFGDLGLILWADAALGSPYVDTLLPRVQSRTSAQKIAGTPTTELAWLLTGLTLASHNRRRAHRSGELAAVFYDALVDNYDRDSQLFCHTRAKTNRTDLRARIGNFADQVYAIYALTMYYELTNSLPALQSALACARRICALQGQQGQWWWHYDTQHGTVASRYPVFSVHQDGMAPMALRRVMAVSAEDFTGPIRHGLDWLYMANELHAPMVCQERNVIWRDIERRRPTYYIRYLTMGLARMGLPRLARAVDRPVLCAVNREMRPYELGWLIYAFADQGTPLG